MTYCIAVHNADFSYSKVAHGYARESLELRPIVAHPHLAQHLDAQQQKVVAKKMIQYKQLRYRVDCVQCAAEYEQNEQIVAASFAFGYADYFEESLKVFHKLLTFG